MRKVKFNKWIEAKYEQVPLLWDNTKTSRELIKGTSCWEEDFPNEGLFHQWGSKTHETHENCGNDTVALIETTDGLIHEITPSLIKFIN